MQEDLSSIPSTHMGDSQTSVTPVPGESDASGLSRHQHTCAHTGCMSWQTCLRFIFLFSYFLRQGLAMLLRNYWYPRHSLDWSWTHGDSPAPNADLTDVHCCAQNRFILRYDSFVFAVYYFKKIISMGFFLNVGNVWSMEKLRSAEDFKPWNNWNHTNFGCLNVPYQNALAVL